MYVSGQCNNLTQAIGNRDLKLVKSLINGGADIGSMLYYASHKGYPEIVEELLNRGADIHAYDDCALIWASNCRHLEVVKLLLDHGANVHAKNNRALFNACYNGHLEVIKELLNRGAIMHEDVNDEMFALETREILAEHHTHRKYWRRWRRFMIGQWAKRLLQVWFRPEMPGGIIAKKHIAQF